MQMMFEIAVSSYKHFLEGGYVTIQKQSREALLRILVAPGEVDVIEEAPERFVVRLINPVGK